MEDNAETRALKKRELGIRPKRYKVPLQSSMIIYNTDNMVQQFFPFRKPIMKYIFNNISASQLLKLYRTCKFFYHLYRLNIIENFEICDVMQQERIVGNSMAIWIDNPSFAQLDNLWISKSFTYGHIFEHELPIKLDLKKFSHLTYSSLIVNGRLNVFDYEFLVKPPTVCHFFINGEVFYPANESLLSIEDMLERAPHVSAFDMYSTFDDDVDFPPIDMDRLIALKRQTKLQSLHLWNVPKIPDPMLVVEFFKKHAATPDIDYYFDFVKNDPEYDVNTVKAFFATINTELQAWKTFLQLPRTIPSNSFIDLTGKLALITACDGIGRATAKLFRQLGASVIVCSRNSIELKSLVKECQNIVNDGFLQTLRVHQLSKEDLKRFKYRFGSKMDILINYCDIFGIGGVPDMKFEEDYLTTHFVSGSQCILSDCATPYLIKAKGTKINVSNNYDLIVDPEEAAFIADCEHDIKYDEHQLVSAGGRVNTVNSGAPITALPRPYGMSEFDYKKLLEKSKKQHEQQIANAIAFLASDAAKLINKDTLHVNAVFTNVIHLYLPPL